MDTSVAKLLDSSASVELIWLWAIIWGEAKSDSFSVVSGVSVDSGVGVQVFFFFCMLREKSDLGDSEGVESFSTDSEGMESFSPDSEGVESFSTHSEGMESFSPDLEG